MSRDDLILIQAMILAGAVGIIGLTLMIRHLIVIRPAASRRRLAWNVLKGICDGKVVDARGRFNAKVEK